MVRMLGSSTHKRFYSESFSALVGASVFAGVFLVARDITEKIVNICERKSESKPKTKES